MLARPDTFEADVTAARGLILRFAMAITHNPDQAEDLVQATIVRALTHRKQFTVGTNLHAWLLTICRNMHRSEYRKRRREVEDVDDAHAKAVPFHDNPVQRMEAVELLRLIEHMPAEWRAPLKLLADGATYEEIAAELNEHVGTVKSRINRAREALKGAA